MLKNYARICLHLFESSMNSIRLNLPLFASPDMAALPQVEILTAVVWEVSAEMYVSSLSFYLLILPILNIPISTATTPTLHHPHHLPLLVPHQHSRPRPHLSQA